MRVRSCIIDGKFGQIAAAKTSSWRFHFPGTFIVLIKLIKLDGDDLRREAAMAAFKKSWRREL